MSDDGKQSGENAGSNEEDDSSMFSYLEPPPELEKDLEYSMPKAPETKESLEEEEKEPFDDYGEDERIHYKTSIKVEGEGEGEGNCEILQQSKEVSAMKQTGKLETVEPSAWVHIGSTRDFSRRSSLNATTRSKTCPGSNRRLLILVSAFCVFIWLIVTVLSLTFGLLVKYDSSDQDDPQTDSDDNLQRIPTIKPTTDTPPATLIEGNGFESIANKKDSIRLNQVSFCDDCIEYVKVPESYLTWNDWTHVTGIVVSSNGSINVICWNAGTCGMIDVVALDLTPNVKGSIYMLWEHQPLRSPEEKYKLDDGQRGRKSTLTVSFEEVMVSGFFDDAPYQVNSQVQISQGEIRICYGGGNIEYNSMRAGFYNYTVNDASYQAASGFPFDKNGDAPTFPEGTCQVFGHDDGPGTSRPTAWYGRTPSPTILSLPAPTVHQPSRPSIWYGQTPSPTISPTGFRTSRPTAWYARTPSPTTTFSVAPTVSQPSRPTIWHGPTPLPTPTPTVYQLSRPTAWYGRTPSPTRSSSVAPTVHQPSRPSIWYGQTPSPTISPTGFRTSRPTAWYARTPSPTTAFSDAPTVYHPSRPTIWHGPTPLPTPTPTVYQLSRPSAWYARTPSPTTAFSDAPTVYQPSRPTSWNGRTPSPTTTSPSIAPIVYRTSKPTVWYVQTPSPTIAGTPWPTFSRIDDDAPIS